MLRERKAVQLGEGQELVLSYWGGAVTEPQRWQKHLLLSTAPAGTAPVKAADIFTRAGQNTEPKAFQLKLF